MILHRSMNWHAVETGAAVPVPREREVHVWQVPLDQREEEIARFEGLLAHDELERAGRFRFFRDRRRFVVARGALRTLLGRYLQVPDWQVDFEYEPKGKPRLGGRSGPFFNVSHSGELALMAFSSSTPLGVDVELLRDMDDTSAIVKRFFSPAETARWTSLPAGIRTRAFFDCWTRKEAYIKAVGEGLSLPLDQFDVTFGPGRTPQISLGGGREGELWSLFDVASIPDYAGALAIPGSGWQLRFLALKSVRMAPW
jgi:4'-phosphopantetheinyl transferase